MNSTIKARMEILAKALLAVNITDEERREIELAIALLIRAIRQSF